MKNQKRRAKSLAVEEENISILTRLGLTAAQAKVYLTLLECKEGTGKLISTHSKVARQEVYRVLTELHEKGLVEKEIAVPTEFVPVPIEACISILIKSKKKEISENRKEARLLLQKFKEKNSNKFEEKESRFSLFPEQSTVRKEKLALDAVQKSFDVITSWEDPRSVIFIDAAEIAQALQRGVRIRVIIDKTDEEKLVSDSIQQLEKYSTFKVRYLPSTPEAFMLIYDNKEIMLCTCTDPMVEKCPTLWTNNPCLLSILQEYFEMKWRTAITSRKPEK
jgi:sugar-specific transcriptional regulator TrmB